MRRWPVAVLGLLVLWPIHAAALTPHEEARAVLDRWLDAQNQGRFDDYRFYYEETFKGVRRSGVRTATFDRDGWMRDRKRMFEKPMTVAADNVHIFANERSARIVFTQRWSSGKYADTGPKELVLHRRPGGSYGIVREELFASDNRKPGTLDLNAFRQFAFVVDGEVVVTTKPDDGWASGPPILEKRGRDSFLFRSRRAVDASKLPSDVTKLSGLAVHLLDNHGIRCEGKLGEFLLRGRAISDVESSADDLWAMSAHTLVARVDGDQKACAGATWARAAALTTPSIASAESPTPELTKRALAAFQALPGSESIQRDLARWSRISGSKSGRSRPWWGRHPPVVRVIRPASGRALLSVSVKVSEGGCSDGVFSFLWALWEVDDSDAGHPRLILRNEPDDTKTLRATAAVDVDGDGIPELLFDGSTDAAQANGAGQPQLLEHGIVRAVGGSYVDIEGPETPIDICPC
jgi:hypothetical protein